MFVYPEKWCLLWVHTYKKPNEGRGREETTTKKKQISKNGMNGWSVSEYGARIYVFNNHVYLTLICSFFPTLEPFYLSFCLSHPLYQMYHNCNKNKNMWHIHLPFHSLCTFFVFPWKRYTTDTVSRRLGFHILRKIICACR